MSEFCLLFFSFVGHPCDTEKLSLFHLVRMVLFSLLGLGGGHSEEDQRGHTCQTHGVHRVEIAALATPFLVSAEKWPRCDMAKIAKGRQERALPLPRAPGE